jgi:Beta-lactamase
MIRRVTSYRTGSARPAKRIDSNSSASKSFASKWEAAHFIGAAAPSRFVRHRQRRCESWLLAFMPSPSLRVLVASPTSPTSNSQSKQTAAREEIMRYSNPDRRTNLKTMTSLAAASSMAKVAVGRAEAATASDPALSPALGDVDQALRQAVNARTVPGLVAIAATDKGIVYEGAFGPSITADSVFWIASMTKAVTGAASSRRASCSSISRWASCSRNWSSPRCSRGSTPAARRSFARPNERSRCATSSLTLRASPIVSGVNRRRSSRRSRELPSSATVRMPASTCR